MTRLIAAFLSLQMLVFNGWRVVTGLLQEAERLIRAETEQRVYAEMTPLFPVPAVEDGFIPQGLCYLEAEDCYVLSAYHESQASVLLFVQAGSGRCVKRLTLLKQDGAPFTGHVGGVASDGTWLYLTDGARIRRLPLAELDAAADGGSVTLADRMTTDLRCAYLSCDGAYLYAGEFYVYTTDGAYDLPADHWVTVSPFEHQYARCCAYPLASLDAAFAAPEQTAAPEFVLSVPNRAQGIARLPGGGFALSTSYGRNNNSFLLTFRDVTAQGADGKAAFGEAAVPLYCLSRADRLAETELPPLLEGIAVVNGSVTGVFESCAQKYADGAYPVNTVCKF